MRSDEVAQPVPMYRDHAEVQSPEQGQNRNSRYGRLRYKDIHPLISGEIFRCRVHWKKSAEVIVATAEVVKDRTSCEAKIR